MKFQVSSFNGLKVTVGTKSVTHPRTHALTDAPKAICPINFFKVGGITRFLLMQKTKVQISFAVTTQLSGNHTADQHFCFHYRDSTIPLLPKSEISSL